MEAIIFFTAIACRIVFASVEKAESWVVKGLDFGSHHFDLMMEKDAKPPLWITLRNIPIETGNSDVKRKLGEYGRIVKGPFYNNHPGTKIKNGLRSALIVVQKDIPSIIYVEDTLNKIRRTVSVFHKGQAPKCFRCNGPHLKKDCTKAVYQPGNGKGKAMGKNWWKQTPFNKPMAKPAPITQTGEQTLPNLDSSDEFPQLVIYDDRETSKRGIDSCSESDGAVSSPNSKVLSRRRRKSIRKRTASKPTESDMSGTESGTATQPDADEKSALVSTPVVVSDATGSVESAMETTADDTHEDIISKQIDKILETSVLETRTVSNIPHSGNTPSAVEPHLEPYFQEQFVEEVKKHETDLAAKMAKSRDKFIKKQNKATILSIKTTYKAANKGGQ